MEQIRNRVVCRRGAMNTLFEVVLAGEDEENLRAAGEAALDEVARVERLLSRFDPTSETSRINREGWSGPVTVDHEMMEIVRRCHEFSLRTDGYFDVTAVSRAGEASGVAAAAVVIDPERRLLRFQRAGLFLDFGGCGKGYALDRAASVLRENGVERALLHGGTSSVRVIGEWTVGVRDPWEPAAEVGRVRLRDEGLACSAASHAAETSDILDPTRGERLKEQAGCVVIMAGEWSAYEAEMLSTGLLAMGRERAALCWPGDENRGVYVGWIGQSDKKLEWLSDPHE